MSFIAVENSSADFNPAPAGVWPGRLYRLIDLGTVTGDWQGQATSSRKILFSFELLDPEAVIEDGRPATVHRRFTLSLGKKAALRAFLESWRGKAFTDAELKGFDLQKLIGIGGLINVTHDLRNERVYANLTSITPPPRGYVIPPAVNTPVVFDCDDPDLNVLEGLGKRLKETIEQSPEFIKAMRPNTSTPAAPTTFQRQEALYKAPASSPLPRVPEVATADFGDDIPF